MPSSLVSGVSSLLGRASNLKSGAGELLAGNSEVAAVETVPARLAQLSVSSIWSIPNGGLQSGSRGVSFAPC